MAKKITKERIKKLLDADVINVTKKIENGKPITQAERTLLLNYTGNSPAEPDKAPETPFVKNQVALANVLGVERKTVQRWRKEPGNPGARPNGTYSVAEWREYAKAKGHKFDDDSNDINATKAKAEQVVIQNKRLLVKYGKEKGDLIPKTLAKQVFAKLLLGAKQRSYASIIRFVTLARMFPSTTEAAEAVRKEMDEIWNALSDPSTWMK